MILRIALSSSFLMLQATMLRLLLTHIPLAASKFMLKSVGRDPLLMVVASTAEVACAVAVGVLITVRAAKVGGVSRRREVVVGSFHVDGEETLRPEVVDSRKPHRLDGRQAFRQ